MALNAKEISAVVAELRHGCIGAEAGNLVEPRRGVYVLMLRGPDETVRILISTQPDASRLHLLSTRVKAPGTVGRFVAALREKLRGAIVEDIEQVNEDRVVRFSLRDAGGAAFYFIVELMGPASNLILLDSARNIILMLRNTGTAGREFSVGGAYRPPRRLERGGGGGIRAEFSGAAGICAAIEKYYGQRQRDKDFREAAAKLNAELKARLKRLNRKREKMSADLKNCSRHEALLHKAELIKANLGSIPKGSGAAKVVDYYSPEMKEIEIELDPGISVGANMGRMFKRAAKQKAALPVIEGRLAKLAQTIGRLTDARDAAIGATCLEQLSDIRAAAGPARRPAPVRPRKETAVSAPRRFVTAEKIEILVGRSNSDNDRLTRTVARGNDIWMHTQNRAGSHVIIRLQRGGSASLETLLDAANLAVYFSKARRSSKVAVDYTRKKFVRKPRGSPPGYVTYSNNKTLIIDPDPSRLGRLLGREEV